MQSRRTLSDILKQATLSRCEFFVLGDPACQGSKTGFGRVGKDPQTGKQRVFVNMVEQDKGLGQWRRSVGNMARLMLPNDWQKDGLFVLKTIFYLPRPKLHYSAVGGLKQSAPVFHSQKKDYDKLLRAIGDSLTGIAYEDDGMIVSGSAMKFWVPEGHGTGAWISIARIDEKAAAPLALELLP